MDDLKQRWRPLTWVAVLIVLSPVLVALIRALDRGWAAEGDRAAVATRAFDVLSAQSPLVGAYSTSSTLIGHNTYSPGPLLYWLLALPAHLPGFLALPVVAAVVNGASLAGAVLIARRQAGEIFMLVAAVLLAVMCSSLPADLSIDIWAPSAPVIPFTLLIFLGWAVASGDVRLLPVAVLAASFVSQCHLAYLVPSVLILLIASAGLVLERRGLGAWEHGPETTGARRSVRRYVVAALVVGVICWSLPVVDQVLAWTGSRGHGNIGHIIDAASSRGKTAGGTAGVHAVVRTIGIPAWWMRGFRNSEARTFDIFAPLSLVSVLTSLLVVAGLCAGLVVGWRRNRPELVTGAAIALGLCLAVAIFTSSFPNRGSVIFSYSYSSWWAGSVGMWAWLVAGWSAVSLVPAARVELPARLRPATAGILAMALVGVGFWAAFRSDAYAVNPNSFAATRSLAAQLSRNLPEGGSVLLEGESFGFSMTTVLTARREGHRVGGAQVARDLGRSYAPAGHSYTRTIELRDGPVAAPGARQLARVTAVGPPPHPVTAALLP